MSMYTTVLRGENGTNEVDGRGGAAGSFAYLAIRTSSRPQQEFLKRTNGDSQSLILVTRLKYCFSGRSVHALAT